MAVTVGRFVATILLVASMSLTGCWNREVPVPRIDPDPLGLDSVPTLGGTR
ncbi:hypothetical protein ACFO4E_19975 [Nocardiopsis mangrovi]|uniref:Lipoprotein n=1 Tax=Nocardiopsis mangrovi TaxID=1179818 RepID=A0ABV9E0P8_9ACTN